MPCHTIPVLSRRSELLRSAFLPSRGALTALMWPPVTFDLCRTESKRISSRWLLKRWILSFSCNVQRGILAYCLVNTAQNTLQYILHSLQNTSPYFTINASKLLSHDLITLHMSYHLGKHAFCNLTTDITSISFIIDNLTVVHQTQKFFQKEFT